MTSAGKTSDLEYHIGYWLRFVSNRVSHSFRDRIAARGVTVAEWVALRSLHNIGPCSLGALAGRMGADMGAVSRIVDRLLRRKLASRAVAARDRRAVAVDLSPAGRRLVPVLAREADLNDDAFFHPLSDRDKDHLLRIMKRLVQVHGLTEKPTE